MLTVPVKGALCNIPPNNNPKACELGKLGLGVCNIKELLFCDTTYGVGTATLFILPTQILLYGKLGKGKLLVVLIVPAVLNINPLPRELKS